MNLRGARVGGQLSFVATTQVAATAAGYAQLLAWAQGLGEPVAWGVEGTGSYGAGLARFLAANGQRVWEVNRPDRAARRRRGKSDPVDADAAARAVQAGEATGIPKAQDGTVEMVRSLRVARQSAVKARTQAINALKALLVTAPTEFREQLEGMTTTKLVRQAAALDPGPLTTPTAAAILALAGLARRCSTWTPRSACSPAPSTSSPSRLPQAARAPRRRPRQRRRAADLCRGQLTAAAQ